MFLKSVIITIGFVFFVFANEPGTKVPDFRLKTWEGKNFSSKEFFGEGIVVLNFWATWCSPCILEMRKFNDLLAKYKEDGLKIVSISVDDSKTVSKVPSLVRMRNFQEFTVLLDTQKLVYNQFFVSNIPELFLVNNEGDIVYHHKGFKIGDDENLELEILKILRPNKI